MAPKVGLEPTTDRLTADCSTTELLRNNKSDLIETPAAFHFGHRNYICQGDSDLNMKNEKY